MLITLLQKHTSSVGGGNRHGREEHGEDENRHQNGAQKEFRCGHC